MGMNAPRLLDELRSAQARAILLVKAHAAERPGEYRERPRIG